MRFFITGTDTGVGKTYVSCLLLRALVQAGLRPAPFKPLCCGDRSDAHALIAAAETTLDVSLVNPCYYKVGLSPAAAAQIEARPFTWEPVMEAWRVLSQTTSTLVVEGAGGWETPLTGEETMAALAVKLGLPVILVVDNKLGALNHTLLTVRAVRAGGLRCAGLILNHASDERDSASISNPAILRSHLPDVPILADLLHGETDLPPGVIECLSTL